MNSGEDSPKVRKFLCNYVIEQSKLTQVRNKYVHKKNCFVDWIAGGDNASRMKVGTSRCCRTKVNSPVRNRFGWSPLNEPDHKHQFNSDLHTRIYLVIRPFFQSVLFNETERKSLIPIVR